MSGDMCPVLRASSHRPQICLYRVSLKNSSSNVYRVAGISLADSYLRHALRPRAFFSLSPTPVTIWSVISSACSSSVNPELKFHLRSGMSPIRPRSSPCSSAVTKSVPRTPSSSARSYHVPFFRHASDQDPFHALRADGENMGFIPAWSANTILLARFLACVAGLSTVIQYFHLFNVFRYQTPARFGVSTLRAM